MSRPGHVVMTISLSKEVAEMLEKYAEETDIPKSRIIARALRQLIEKENGGKRDE